MIDIYFSDISEFGLITPQEEVRLAARIKKGDRKARETMIKANLRLVVKIAREYERYGVPLLDLINEGNMGLMKAVGRFDPAKGAKFSTYAGWWIRQVIKRALSNQSRTIRLTINVVEKQFRARQVSAMLHHVLGREPSEEELAEELGISVKRLHECSEASTRLISLDAPLADGEANYVADHVADVNAILPSAQTESADNVLLIRDMLGRLSNREAEILRRRFGLNGYKKQPLEAVGKIFGVTRERVRQIQAKALKRLREWIRRLEKIE